MPQDGKKRHPWGEDGRVDPEDLVPDDEEKAVGPDGPTTDSALRALSVLPFLLVAALGLIGVISWLLIVLLGAGSAEPIWRSLRGLSPLQVVWQLLLALLIGLVPLFITLGASWATARGFREESGRTFWILAQGLWGLIAVTLVYLERSRPQALDQLGLTATDWWFGFGVVAFAMILAGVRLRRAPRPEMRGR